MNYEKEFVAANPDAMISVLIVNRMVQSQAIPAGEIEELYDLEDDPEELTNLALDATHAERVERMRKDAVAELKRTGAGFVDTLPAVRGE